ncbi:uncharacterized protein Z518_11220 [Rhinocladiella mackenziei CBS 650.93]|uniref:AB hydrolase-1 domain-containing protein n=1 Tax=Rhinocladiella mackenziei CBS 650.93 TaxID=1442369 RepID=A0A0D2FBM1_9EURO|nr:uncharacterized protein Z518_11220 [Rhinocladiella mackenziei CBS 650.93]KIW99481.1 hypothetical protein Z518_11220 [Rhinocladiella mackenziei CBS 650.93]
MPSISTRAGEISYAVQGKGQPIIMLHATLHDGHDYETIAARLAERYQTITVDWPWHGSSKGVSTFENLNAVGFANVLEDFVSGLSIEPAIFIGNSVGGFAAARLAINRPESVRGLVLVNTGGFVDWNLFSRLVTRMLGFATVSRIVMPHLVRRYMSPQTSHDEEITRRAAARAGTVEGAKAAAALWRSFLDDGHDLRPRAKDMKTPVLLVWGTRDPIFPLSAGQAAHRYIPGSRLEPFDAGHVVFSSKPDHFLEVVEPFIESTVTADQQT